MRKFTNGILTLAMLIGTGSLVTAQRIMVTLAGTGYGGTGSGDAGYVTRLGTPNDVCIDAAHNVYIVDQGGLGRVLKVSALDGVVTVVAGGGSSTVDGVPATSASLAPYYICVDATGNLYVSTGSKVRKIDAVTNIITTVAGTLAAGYSGDSGPAVLAQLNTPRGVSIDASGDLFIADLGNHRIRRVDAATGFISTIAGTGLPGYTGDGSPAALATLADPTAICVNPAGDVFFSDQSGSRIRRIDAVSGIITTIAGSGGGIGGNGGPAISAGIGNIYGMCCDGDGNLYIDDISCSCREIDMSTGIIHVVAGDLYMDGYNGDGADAITKYLNFPFGICVDGTGSLYIADRSNYRVRKAIQLTNTPSFAFGKGEFIYPCPGITQSLNDRLAITDLDLGQTETWTIVSGPATGTLSGFPYSCSSAGTSTLTTPAGLNYIPAAGYTGPDMFVVRVSDGSSSDTLTVYVNVRTLSPGTISGPSSVCTASAIILSATAPFGFWTASNANATVGSYGGNVTGVSPGTDTVTYTVTASCIVSVSTVITINAAPAPGVISGSDTVCVGSSTTLTESVPGGAWSVSSANATIGSASGIISGVAFGNPTVSYTVHNTSCTSVAIRLQRVWDFASPLAGSYSICLGETSSISDGVPGGVWTATNSTASVVGGGYYASILGVSLGVDTIVYTNTNMCGSGSVTKTVTVAPIPDPGIISGPSAVCIGSTVTLSSTVSGGYWTSMNSNASVAAVLGDVTGVSAGTDSIFYAFSDGITGCSAYAGALITVGTAPDAGLIMGPSAICAGAGVTLSDPSSGGVWTVTNPLATISGGGLLTGLAPGTDTVNYTVTVSCGSVSAISVINIDPLPDAGTVTGADNVCPGATITLSDLVSGGGWSIRNSNASITGAGVVTGLLSGTDTADYAVSNGCGTAYAFLPLTINSLPDAGMISGLDNVTEGSSVTLSNSAGGGAWSSSNTAISTVSPIGIVYGVTPGTDSIIYAATNTCGTAHAFYTFTVKAKEDITSLPATSTVSGSIVVSPNPARSNFTINVHSAYDEPVTITITNIAGEKLKEITGITNKPIMAELQVAAGVYLLNTASAHISQGSKLVIE